MLLISSTVLFRHFFFPFIQWKKQVPHNYFTFINTLQSMGFGCVCEENCVVKNESVYSKYFRWNSVELFHIFNFANVSNLCAVLFTLAWIFRPKPMLRLFMYANKKNHLCVWFISFGLKWTDRSYLHNNKWTAIFVMFISISTQIDDLSETKFVLLKNCWRI